MAHEIHRTVAVALEDIQTAAAGIPNVLPTAARLTIAWEGSGSETSERALNHLGYAAHHADRARTELAAGIGHYTAYLTETGLTGPTETAAVAAWSAAKATPHDPEASSDEAPSLVLDYSREELLDLLDTYPLGGLRTIKAGKVYELPGRPDLVLRRISAWRVTGSTDTVPQREAHIIQYELQLRRLHAAGVKVLPHVTYLVPGTLRNRDMFYTIVTKHPNPVSLQDHLARNPLTPATEALTLHTIDSLCTYYIGAARSGNTINDIKMIWDIATLDQYAIDGSLLDYDPYLTGKFTDVLNALATLSNRLIRLPDSSEKRRLSVRLDEARSELILRSIQNT